MPFDLASVGFIFYLYSLQLSPKWEPAVREVKLKDGTVISSTPVAVEATAKINFAITPEQLKSLPTCGSVF